MPIPVKAHARPMKRHTQHVREASADVEVRLDAKELHLVLTIDGATQRVVFGAEGLATLHKLVRAADAGVNP